MADFSHLNEHHQGQMVDISTKKDSERLAVVRGLVSVSQDCHEALSEAALAEITTTSRIAGVQAAKDTSRLIPYCHQVPLSQVKIVITYKEARFYIEAHTKTTNDTESKWMP